MGSLIGGLSLIRISIYGLLCYRLMCKSAGCMLQVRVLFRPSSVEVWALGACAAYHIHIPKLYQQIATERCTFKANSKRQKVYLLLHKRSDAEWRFLKG